MLQNVSDHGISKGRPEQKKRMYVMLDDQSNSSLAKSAFFDIFNIQGMVSSYTLKTCSGITETSGRRATDFHDRGY